MNKTLILLLSVLAFSQVTLADDKTLNVTETLNHYAACARGALQGFEKAYYNNATFEVSPSCLGPKQMNKTYSLYQAYMTGSIINVF